MAKPAPRWIDAPEFHWNPEQPFRVEPQLSSAPPPANDDDDAGVAASDETPSRPAAKPARLGHGYLLSRLVIGLAQGFGLLSLLAGHGAPALLSPMGLVLLFAPLLLLAGLGQVVGKVLLPWTVFASLALALLGAYQQWRGPEMYVLVMVGLLLFIGQTLILASAKSRRVLADYADYHASAWSLGLRVVLCAMVAAASYVLADTGFALLRQSHPTWHPSWLITPIVTLSVAAMSWLAAPSFLRLLQKGVEWTLTLMLPLLLVLAAAAGVAGLLLHWQPPLLLCLALGFALLACLNASYRDGAGRARWREILEFAAALVLPAPVLLGVTALFARLHQLGWTDTRLLAAAALALLTAYAVFYIASALIALGGGGWMKRIERANLVLAIVALGLLAALLSPIADPARLAVASQMQRLDDSRVPAEAFDFDWLRSSGGHFGHQALEQLMARKNAPTEARGAFFALIDDPDDARPAPTEIGANIDVRTGNGRLPSALLGRDWSQVKTPGVPPCLTKPGLSCDAYFMDLDGDGRDEIVLVYGNAASWWAGVMKEDADGVWNVAGTLSAPSCAGSFDALRAGRFAPVAPLPGWRDLLVAGTRLTVAAAGDKNTACPTPQAAVDLPQVPEPVKPASENTDAVSPGPSALHGRPATVERGYGNSALRQVRLKRL